jgi:hypothetical protein
LIFFPAVLGLLFAISSDMNFKIASPILLASLFVASASASACVSTAMSDGQGRYTGCSVKLADREFILSSEKASEAGCRQVCGILGEVREIKGNVAAHSLRASNE